MRPSGHCRLQPRLAVELGLWGLCRWSTGQIHVNYQNSNTIGGRADLHFLSLFESEDLLTWFMRMKVKESEKITRLLSVCMIFSKELVTLPTA
jgi:hypothetical protein